MGWPPSVGAEADTMFRRAGPLTLGQYARESYTLTRDIRPGSARQMVIAADLLERWAGGPVPLAGLDEPTVSSWLRDYSATVKPHTVRGKRNMILALWRAAADDGLAEEPVGRRVRRQRAPALPVDAWTREEVCRLLAACQGLQRRHRCGLPRAAWFDLAVRVAWDLGLRWGDLIQLPVSAVRDDGAVQWAASKTAKVSIGRLSSSTMAALRASLAACPRALVCPWPASHETFTDQVIRLVSRAGIRAGTWKWIRRASGSDVEAQQLGAGHQHLGNTPAVFDASYGDRSIIGRRIPQPRELLVEALRAADTPTHTESAPDPARRA